MLSLSPRVGCGALPVPEGDVALSPGTVGMCWGCLGAFPTGQYGPAGSLAPSPWAVGGQGASLGLSNARELQTTPLPSLGHDLGVLFGQWRQGLCSPWSVSHNPVLRGDPGAVVWAQMFLRGRWHSPGVLTPLQRQAEVAQRGDVPMAEARMYPRELSPRSGTVSSVGVTGVFHDFSLFFVGSGVGWGGGCF